MTIKKVLIAVEERMLIQTGANTFAQTARALSYARQICHVHGYQPDVRVIRSTAATEYDDLTTNDYAFCIVPRVRPGENWHVSSEILSFLNGSLGITTFVLSARPWGVGDIEGAVGTIRNTSSVSNFKCLWGDKEVYTRGQPQNLDGNKDTTAIVVSEDDATDVLVWRLIGNNGAVYCDASEIVSGELYGGFWPIMFQEAINAGHVEAPPRRALTCIDLDDFPDATTTLSDVETLYALMRQYSIPLTIGINPSIDAQVDSEILEYIADRTWLRGGLFYPIVHNTNTTALDMTAVYATVKSQFEGADGIGYMRDKFGDDMPLHQGKYTYFPNNDVADGFMRLANEYGVTSIRVDGAGAAEDGIFEPAGSIQDFTRRGVRVLGSSSPFTDTDNQHAVDSSDEILAFLVGFGQATILSAYYLQPFYFHGTEVYIDHTGSTAPGYRFLERYGAMINACADVIRFAHPSELKGR